MSHYITQAICCIAAAVVASVPLPGIAPLPGWVSLACVLLGAVYF